MSRTPTSAAALPTTAGTASGRGPRSMRRARLDRPGTPPDISPSILTDIASRSSARDLEPGPDRASGDIAPSRTVSRGERFTPHRKVGSKAKESPGQALATSRGRDTGGKHRQETAHGSHEQQSAGAGDRVRRRPVRRHGMAVAAPGPPELAGRQRADRTAAVHPGDPVRLRRARRQPGLRLLRELGGPVRPGDRPGDRRRPLGQRQHRRPAPGGLHLRRAGRERHAAGDRRADTEGRHRGP